jgi:hypothetical protein
MFLIEDFFHLPPVSATPVVNLELPISPRLLEKRGKRRNNRVRGRVINGTGEMRRGARRDKCQMRGKRRECKQIIRGGTGNRSYEG